MSILKTLKSKKIAMLGLGIENYALVKYLLEQKVKCAITVIDSRSGEDLWKMYAFLKNKKNIAFKLCDNTDQHLDGFDLLFRSPGWPLRDPWIKKAEAMGVEVTSAIRLFFKLCPTGKIIGVTGTKGKGTTASLINAIIKEAGKTVWLGGNIGIAPFDFIDKIRKTDYVVLELSSFQLEDLDLSPHIAVITNFSREHLAPADPNNPNYHKNIHEYWLSKLNIIRWQKRHDFAVLNQRLEDHLAQPTSQTRSGNGKKIFFKKIGSGHKTGGQT
jgi:UDP-N-acetylmuramoylalanine--D-glutamate ligase